MALTQLAMTCTEREMRQRRVTPVRRAEGGSSAKATWLGLSWGFVLC